MKYKLQLCLLTLVLLTGCTAKSSSTQTITITHKLGTTKTHINPQKVVVFDMGIIDMMDTYQLPIYGVPKASLTSSLQKYSREDLFDAGSLFEPNFEALSEAAPDLIIISGRTAKQYEELTKIAPTLYMGHDSHPDGLLASMKTNTQMLHELYPDHELNDHINVLETQTQAFRDRVIKKNETLLFIMANGNEIKSFGPGSRYDHVYSEFGFKPVDHQFESSTHGSALSFELLQHLDPGIILVMDRAQVTGGESNAKALMDNSFVKATTAYKNNHIIYVNPETWYLTEGGYQGVTSMLVELEPLLSAQ